MGNDIVGLAVMLMVLVFIISGVQWFFVRYTHWSIAMVATGFISLFVSGIYVSMSNASPNGAGNGLDILKFITPTLVIFGALLCGLALVCHLTQNQLPKKVFIISLSLIVAFFMIRIGINILTKYLFTPDYLITVG